MMIIRGLGWIMGMVLLGTMHRLGMEAQLTVHHLRTEVAKRMVSIAVILDAARGKAADVT